MAKSVTLFCGLCNAEKQFSLAVDARTSEFVATADHANGPNQCFHALKFPPTADVNDLRGWLAAHNEANKPAIFAADIEAQQSALNGVLEAL